MFTQNILNPCWAMFPLLNFFMSDQTTILHKKRPNDETYTNCEDSFMIETNIKHKA